MREYTREKAVIEAALFLTGDPVSAADLASVLELPEKEVVRLVHEMQIDFEDTGRGLRILELEDSFVMATAPELSPELLKLTAKPKKLNLSDAVLETLSIIAWKQPATRADVEKIRGVGSDYAINRLIEYGLIEEKGREDAPGRPILFGTTEEFLRVFGLSSIDDLPVVDETFYEGLKKEAESEISEDRDLLQDEEKKNL